MATRGQKSSGPRRSARAAGADRSQSARPSAAAVRTPPPGTHGRRLRLAVRLAAFALLLLLLGAVLTLLALPPLSPLGRFGAAPPVPRLAIGAADGTLLAEEPGAPRVDQARLPPHVRAAFAAAADGVPEGIGAILRAVLSADGAPAPLSLRVVDSLLPGDRDSLLRRIRLPLAALWLGMRHSRDELLHLWLAYGRIGTAFGVEQAARRYFGRPAAELDPLQAAMLAGLAGLPPHMSPFHTPATARRRAVAVLQTMTARGFFTPEEAERWASATFHLARRPPFARDAVDAALRELARLGPTSGDLHVETAVDPTLQRAVERTVERKLAGRDGLEAAVVVLDGEGRIAALFGGRSRFGPNRALDLPRQPGSAFKLLLYAAALEAGWRPDDAIADAPVTIEGWSPRNLDGRFHGTVTLAEAFAHSYNAAAVRLQEAVGRTRIIRLARALGIRAPLAPVPSLALGTHEITPLELARATWALICGRTTPGAVVVRIDAADGTVLDRAGPGGAVPLGGRTREALKAMMRQAVRSGTARAAAVSGLDVGAKTGTSQGSRDGWIAGFAGSHVIVVWVGRDDAQPVPDLMGGGLPALIFHDIARSLAKHGS